MYNKTKIKESEIEKDDLEQRIISTTEDLIKNTEIAVREVVLHKLQSSKHFSTEELKSAICDVVSPFLFNKTQRRPMILPIIMEI